MANYATFLFTANRLLHGPEKGSQLNQRIQIADIYPILELAHDRLNIVELIQEGIVEAFKIHSQTLHPEELLDHYFCHIRQNPDHCFPKHQVYWNCFQCQYLYQYYRLFEKEKSQALKFIVSREQVTNTLRDPVTPPIRSRSA